MHTCMHLYICIYGCIYVYGYSFLDINLNENTKTRFMVRGWFISYLSAFCEWGKDRKQICFCASVYVPNTEICTWKHIYLYINIHKVEKSKGLTINLKIWKKTCLFLEVRLCGLQNHFSSFWSRPMSQCWKD